MTRLLSFVVLILSVAIGGCKGGAKGPIEADVQGTVNMDKKPLKEGMIVFVTPGAPATPIDIKGGTFSGKAKVGENLRVEVYSYKETSEKNPMTGEIMKTKTNTLPAAYNTESRLNATVKEAGENKFHFEVTSR